MEEGKDIEYIHGCPKIYCEISNFCKNRFYFSKKRNTFCALSNNSDKKAGLKDELSGQSTHCSSIPPKISSQPPCGEARNCLYFHFQATNTLFSLGG